MTEGRTYINPRTQAQDRAKGELKQLRHIACYIKPYWREVGLALIGLVVGASSVLSIGIGLRYLIDEGFSKQNAAFLDIALLVLFGMVVLLAAAAYLRFYFITKVGEQVVADIRRDVYQRLLGLSAEFFELTKRGEVLSRLTTDTAVIQLVVGSSLSIALRNTLMLIGGIVMLVITSPKLTAYIIIVVPIIVLNIIKLGKKVRKLSRASQDKVAEVASHLDETLSAMKIVQAYGQEDLENERFSRRVNEALQAALKRVSMRARLTALVIVLVFGAVGLVLWIGGKDVLSGGLSAGELSSFVFYSVLVAGAVGAISEVISDLQRAAGATERLVELLHTLPTISVPEQPKTLPEPCKGEIRLDNVSFSYPTRPETAAIDEMNFEVSQGETIALVGPSGSGKSTLLQLLLRFYDPQEGEILLDGVNIKELDPKALRSHFAFVSQDSIIFSDSVEANIRYGNSDATQEEVEAAAKAARAHEFISKLPDRYETYVGEKGVRLSGGERQRLAIARAIIREPQILLLDEATNALDAENEQLVQEALESVMQRCTTIVIAHRLATVLNADKIIVIHEGKIESMGTHEELVARGSLYARLAELQFGT